MKKNKKPASNPFVDLLIICSLKVFRKNQFDFFE